MAKKDWKLVGFRLPECQVEMLDAFIAESDEFDSQQGYLHSRVLEDIEDVELEDPRTELESLRQQKRELRDDIEDVTDDLDDLRGRLDDLEERERELEKEVEESTSAGAKTYEEAVRETAAKIVEEDKRIMEKSSEVTRIADEWVEEKMTVLRDIYEADPRITPDQLASHRGEVPRSDWQYRVGEDREEAVELVGRYIDVRSENGVRISTDDYLEAVAEAHEADIEELTRDAVEPLDVEFGDVIFGLDEL